MGYIYKITNTVNNKCYIGETIQTPEKRWKDHINALKRDGGCRLLKNAVNKHGIANFKFEVLIICFDEDRLIYEKEYIKKYTSQTPNGYNILAGGQEGVLGLKHSEETKKKIALKAKEHNSKPEVKEKARERMIELNTHIKSGEILQKTLKWQNALEAGRIRRQGKNLDDETKRKISESLKKFYENNNTHRIDKEKHSKIMTKVRGRKIVQYTKENVLVSYYDSIVLAGKATGIKHGTIQSAVSGRLQTAGGFIWKYFEESGLKDVLEDNTCGEIE